MQAFVWWTIGFLCFGIETMSFGSFVFVFFGLAAFVVAATTLMRLTDELTAQAVVFVTVAALSMVVLRRRLRRYRDKEPAHGVYDDGGDELATAAEFIAPGAVGQVELRGTVWKGLNAGKSPLLMGQTYRVVRIDNLTVVLMDRGTNGELK